jgi:hypothetical protein
MTSEALEFLFQAKSARRSELARLPIADKMKLIEALRDVGLYLRRVRPQLGSVKVKVQSAPPAVFDEVIETSTFEPDAARQLGISDFAA